MFTSIFSQVTDQTAQSAMTAAASISIANELIAIGISLILGLMIAVAYMIRSEYNKSFVVTLVLLPAIVQVVILLVNGNLGTAVAIVGAFSLVRFRSVPGTAKEISVIFLCMAVGLATGTGYLLFALLFTIIVCVVLVLLNILPFGEKKAANPADRTIKVVLPENLDYNTIYDDLFADHLEKWELSRVKTTNMGSMYELTYLVTFKDVATEKKLIDDMRCRNGNLPIVSSKLPTTNREEL